jgi:small GTP-binding protein
LDLDVLLAQSTVPVVTYTSAKVVLVGESNVGKSYLAHRIGTGKAPEEGTIKSTHGMTFWPMAPETLSPEAKAPEGQRRDVVLWDLGGQDEYRLIHQLFLHDTTVALVLLDPTRGRTEFQDVETWNKALERQLRGRRAVKLLVGSKMDELSDTSDRQGLERLQSECGFAGYYETSALTGRGVAELSAAVAWAIDWEGLGQTSRPELFQRIRDVIEDRRKRGEVVLHVSDLHRALSDEPPTDEQVRSVDAVSGQLAAQGVIARSRVATGEPVLVLQVQEVERYGGSLIIAARNNPRGVPALEVAKIARPDFVLPGIPGKERLPRTQELPVLECTVRLLVEHGICFEHEGLLVFPTSFASSPSSTGEALPTSASLYYDFSGAIDNIYASLIAWLVLARDFGRVRLLPNRAEFEFGDKGLCGLRKVSRPGGFAHLDVYFQAEAADDQRKLFIDFVEQHLRERGVTITERIMAPCPKGYLFDEETLHIRISEGSRDVICPRCEVRHPLTEGAATARQTDPGIMERAWALKTKIEKRRKASAVEAVKVLEQSATTAAPSGPIYLLHLSDLHFTADTPVHARLQWLLDDLRLGGGWGRFGIERLDYLVVSGDFTDKGGAAGFEKAYEFVSALASEFGLSAERCVFVPGNHDVTRVREAYEWREKSEGLKGGEWVQQGEIVLARNAEKYPLRLKPFSDALFHKFFQKPYPTTYADQGLVIPFWETGIQFLGLNSCWEIDQFFPKRSGIFPEAVAQTLRVAQKQEAEARKTGDLKGPLLRIAVWHHAVAGEEQMKDTEFLGHLQNNGVRIGLHGDVHQLRRDLVGYWHAKKLHVVGSGSFGARHEDCPEATPRLYNLLEISRDLTSARVHTRSQPKPDGAWKGWYEWDNPDGAGKVPFYDIAWGDVPGTKTPAHP